MKNLATTAEREPAAMPTSRLLAVYLEEARSECLRYLRMPGFMLPTIFFPAVFYLMFGVLMADKMGGGEFDMARFLLGSYSTFGVMAPGLFGFGVSLAMDRENGLLTLKRALPMPPLAYLIAKMLMAMLVAAIVVVILLLLAVTVGGVELSSGQALTLFGTDVLGVLPFCAIGLWIGCIVNAQGAPAVVNLIYLPLAFLSGLWIPLQVLPKMVGTIAPLWPSYHLNQLAQDAVGMRSADTWLHVLVLLAYTVVFLGLGARRLRRAG